MCKGRSNYGGLTRELLLSCKVKDVEGKRYVYRLLAYYFFSTNTIGPPDLVYILTPGVWTRLFAIHFVTDCLGSQETRLRRCLRYLEFGSFTLYHACRVRSFSGTI